MYYTEHVYLPEGRRSDRQTVLERHVTQLLCFSVLWEQKVEQMSEEEITIILTDSPSKHKVKMSWSRSCYVPLYPDTHSTLPRHGAQWNILTGPYVLVNFFKNLSYFLFQVTYVTVIAKEWRNAKKSRKLQIKTASSFNRVRKSKCSTVPRSPLPLVLHWNYVYISYRF